MCANEGLSALLQEIITETGYVEELKVEGTDEAQRVRKYRRMITKVVSYEQETDEPTLSGFLEEVALVADIELSWMTTDLMWSL